MRPMIAAFVVTMACSRFVAGVEAQESCACSNQGQYLGETVGNGATLGAPVARPVILGETVGSRRVLMATPTSYVAPLSSSTPRQIILPYSYYAGTLNPARVYVEYGATDQFPFYGRAYGNPGDRWSWYTLAGGSSRYLARYYYPPIR